MARRSTYQRQSEPEPEMDISSLIDVSFLLILYFLVTSTLQPKEVDVGISLPSAAVQSEPSPQTPLTLKLNVDGSVIAQPENNPQSLGTANASFEFPELRGRLETYVTASKQMRQDPFVVLLADDQADHQMLMNVFNTIYEVGITNVTLSGFRQN